MPKRSSHFFALRPVPGALGELGELRDRCATGGWPVRDDRLHATLFWLGYDGPGTPALATRACEAAGTVIAPAFRICFDQLVAADHGLLIRQTEPPDRLHGFQRALAAALARLGVRADPRWRFDPHVTLRRGAAGRAAAATLPIAWTVTEFVLIRSLVEPFRHQVVRRWPLGDDRCPRGAPGSYQMRSSPSSSPSQ